jgi:adenylosuccinate synthase
MGDEGKGKIVDVLTKYDIIAVFKEDQMQVTLRFEGINMFKNYIHIFIKLL